MDYFDGSINARSPGSNEDGFNHLTMKSAVSVTSSAHYIEPSATTLQPRIPVDSALPRTQALLQTILEGVSDGVCVINAEGIILEVNTAALALSQRSSTVLIGTSFEESFHFLDQNSRAPLVSPLEAAIAHNKKFRSRFSAILVDPSGTEISVKMRVSQLSVDGSEAAETVIIFQDVTKRRILSQQLHWQANHDPITGLVNRIYFEEIIAQALQKQCEKQSYVLAQIDIDNFKLINDTCGNLAGDQLLGQLAVLFQEQIRSVDALARLGGDEFGILFHQCSLDEVHQIILKLQERLTQFRYVWQEKNLEVFVSVGLVRLDEETTDVEIALSKADTACYTAKNRGRSRIQVFSSRDVAMEDLRRHQEWNFLIREAIEEGRFQLYRQPIVGIDRLDTFPHHYEVLLRMVDSVGGIIGPNRFIPTAERYQLMPVIDRWVIGQCLSHLECMAVSEPSEPTHPSANYAINLSGASLSDQTFLTDLINRVAVFGVSHKNLCFEITETAAITNLQQVTDFMKALKQMGCRFSLDDFGAGMSSFGYLSTLPVDFVKIDGKFIQDIEVDPSNATIVESIVHVSKSLGLMTIAERVEDKAIAYRLKEIGVDFIQGFAVGRPHRWI